MFRSPRSAKGTGAGRIRLISGSLRGRYLACPQGASVRPTSSLMRGAIFDILAGYIPGARVLDLYAGVGALGLEAISRGARLATFVEKDPLAAKFLARNIHDLGLDDRCLLIRASAMDYLSKRPETYDIVLADPPYRPDISQELLEAVALARILGRGGVFVFQHDPGLSLPPPPPGLYLWKSRRHGHSQATFYIDRETI